MGDGEVAAVDVVVAAGAIGDGEVVAVDVVVAAGATGDGEVVAVDVVVADGVEVTEIVAIFVGSWQQWR